MKQTKKNVHVVSRKGLFTGKLDDAFPQFLEGHVKEKSPRSNSLSHASFYLTLLVDEKKIAKAEYVALISRFSAAYAIPTWPFAVVFVGLGMFCYSLSLPDISFVWLVAGLALIVLCFACIRQRTANSDAEIRALCREANSLLASRGITWEYTNQLFYNGMKHVVIHELVVSLKDHTN